MEVLAKPALDEACAALKAAVAEGRTCVIAARCSVKYRGRASSTLGSGERIVLLKQDGSVLVHRPTGHEPANWQPAGSVVSSEVAGGRLLLRCVRLKPWEELLIELEEVFFVAYGKLRDEGELRMYGSEREVRDYLVENPHLIEDGLQPVKVERKAGSGFVDALFVDSQGRLVVVEVKRGVAGVEAAVQLKRYVETLGRELGREVRGILAAERLAKGVQAVLAREGLEFKRIDPALLRQLAATRGGTGRLNSTPSP